MALSHDQKLSLFKNTVINMIKNRDSLTHGNRIPEEVDESLLPMHFKLLFQSDIPTMDRFIITRFVIYETEDKIVLEYENASLTEGGGAVIGFDYDSNLNVTYRRLFNAFYI